MTTIPSCFSLLAAESVPRDEAGPMRELYRAVPHLRERSGRSDIGIVLASLTGPARIEGPSRQLVSFFRDASRVRVKDAMPVRAIELRDRAGALRAAAAGPR